MQFTMWLLKNRGLVLAATALVVAAGALSWLRLPIDAFPDVTNTQVMILAKAPGLAAVDVEQRITYPIEQIMRGLPRVTQVRSLSKPGLSQVVMVFEDGADPYWTRQVVFERLATVREQLPPAVEPELAPLSTGLGEIFQYTIEGEGYDTMDLRTIQDWLVAPLLKPIAGVNEINSFGGHVKQYQVLLAPDKLLEYGLTADSIVEAVERNNANAGGGVVVRGWEQLYLRGVGLLKDVADIERIVITAADGAPVYLRDLGDVVIGGETRQGAATRDGNGEVVAGMVIMLKGENSRDVVARVNGAIERVRNVLPPGVRVNVFYDRTSLIGACIATVVDALLEGAVFVVLVLFLFIAELRSALIVVFSLPLTFLASFVVMHLAGISSNLMSLGGLAFSVGMVVDGSIVVVENVRRHLGRSRSSADRTGIVVAAVTEVARPVSFSILIIALILVPLFSLQGIEGKMFAPLAATMLIAMLLSLGVALTVVPVLTDMLLARSPERQFGFVSHLQRGYLRFLERATARPAATVGIAGATLVAALGLVPLVGTEFLPPLDEGSVVINVTRLPNASLEGSVRVASFVEKRLLAFPEVETVVSKTGRAEISEDPMGPEQSDVFVMLKARKEWKTGRDKHELIEAMQAALSEIPGLRFSFSQPIALRVNELVSGVKSDLAVKVFGADLAVLKEFADKAATILAAVPGARDVKVEQVAGMSQIDVAIDRDAVARYGINVADVNATLETAFAGKQATTLIEGQRRFAVVVRFPRPMGADIAAIEGLLIAAPGGARVPLGQLASVEEVEAPAQVSRENGLRRVVVEANVRGRDLGSFVAEVRTRLDAASKALPTGYFVEYGGQFENQRRAMRQLSIVLPVALTLVLALLYMALGSAGNALLVLLNLPFALVGGVIGVVLFRMTLSVSAAVAFVVLLGIAVQNGVVLVALFHQLRQQGRSIAETVRDGCDLRFRPLLMTALVSFIGHLPMLYSTGAGADIQRPLAVVVMGGLVTSTLLTLIVLPVCYGLLETSRSRSPER